MAYPDKADQLFSFTGFSTTSPEQQQPGAKLDAEFNELRFHLEEVVDFLEGSALSSTGPLNTLSVTLDQLDTDLVEAIWGDDAPDFTNYENEVGAARDAAVAAQAAAETAETNAETAETNAETAQAAAEAARDTAQDAAGGFVEHFKTTTVAESEDVASDIQHALILEPRAFYQRVAAEPSHALKFRSTDRFMPDGSENSSDGGWWEINPTAGVVSVDQAGAVDDGATDATAAFQACVDFLPAGGGRVLVPGEDYAVTVGTLNVGSKVVVWDGPAKINAVTNRALPGLNIIYSSVGRVIFNKDDAAADDFAGFEFLRDADYSGAGAGGVSSNVRVFTDVGANAGSVATTESEWALNTVIDNNSGDVNAVAVSGVARRHADGPVWAGHFQSQDNTNPTATSRTFGIETNIVADGVDANDLRSVLNIVAKNHADVYDPGADSIAHAILIHPGSADFKYGVQMSSTGGNITDDCLKIGSLTPETILRSVAVSSVADILLSGNSQVGLICNGVYGSGNAIRVSDDQHIAFKTNGTKKFRWSTSLTAFELIGGNLRLPADPSNDLDAAPKQYVPTVSAKSHGAVGDGATDDSAAIQAAIDAVNTAGGGTVWFPAGTYIVGTRINAKDGVTLRGQAGKSIVKVQDGADANALKGGGSAGSELEDFSLIGMVFDGNKANRTWAVGVGSTADISGFKRLFIRDCTFKNGFGYGLGMQARPDTQAGGWPDGVQEDGYLENCRFLNNGDGDGVGGDTFDGLDVKDCDGLTLVGCYAEGNSDKGIDIRGERVSLTGCYASGNRVGFGFAGNSNGEDVETNANVANCQAQNNTNAGFQIADGHTSPTKYVRVSLNGIVAIGNGFGVNTTVNSSKITLTISDASIINSTSHGVNIPANVVAAIIRGSVLRGSSDSGIFLNADKVLISDCHFTLNSRYGVEEEQTSGPLHTVIGGATRFEGNTLGSVLWFNLPRATLDPSVMDYDKNGDDIIASATTVTLPEGGQFFAITGTTNIDTITASPRGRIVTIHFTGVLTVGHNTGNVLLDGGVNLTTAANDQLTLVCDGTNWRQMALSSNA